MSNEMVETSADIRRHELLADVAEQAARLAMDKLKVSEDAALDFGNQMADYLSEHWKGQNIYMNADAQFKLSKRDLLIFQRMERGNAHEIGKDFGISYVRVYQIYKRCLAIARSRTQPGLFEEPGIGPEARLSTASKAGK